MGSINYGPPRGYRRQKRCSRGEPKAMDLRRRFANLPKESEVRSQFNRRMRKTARPVVWEGDRVQTRSLDPIETVTETATQVLL